jgi:hypothetical protein
MRKAVIYLMILDCGLFGSSAVLAEDVEIHRDTAPGVVIPFPVPAPAERDTVIEHRGSDCETTTVHKENDRGDSKTVEKRRCD